MKRVRVEPEARTEIEDAATWYESCRPGLADDFSTAVEEILAKVAERPAAFPPLLDTDPEMGLRRALLQRFPYSIVFLETAEEIRVVAVAHMKRRPGYWLSRVRS